MFKKISCDIYYFLWGSLYTFFHCAFPLPHRGRGEGRGGSTVLYHRWVRRETRTKRRVWNGWGIHLDLLLPFVVAEKKLKFIEPNAENDESVDVDYHPLLYLHRKNSGGGRGGGSQSSQIFQTLLHISISSA